MIANNSWAPPVDEGPHQLGRSWGWLVALGVSLVVVGFAAIAWPVLATLTTVTAVGILLLVAAGVQLVSVVWVRRWGSFFHHLLSGLLYLFLGLVLVERPGLGAAGYTLVMAVFFVAAGAARTAFALSHRFPGRGWAVFSGLVSVLLGVLIWREFPESALWVIGTFIGIELVFNGVSWVMLGLAVRRARDLVESRLPDHTPAGV